MENINSIHSFYQAPSNIALIKYWGKMPKLKDADPIESWQIPLNPSLSLTLKNCKTNMQVQFIHDPDVAGQLEFYFHQQRNLKFEKKIISFLQNAKNYYSFVQEGKLIIHSENTFPHSSGIASSASSMAALNLCLMDLLYQLKGASNQYWQEKEFRSEVSKLARLASGSACRSIEGGLNLWGNFNFDDTVGSNLFATQLLVDSDFLMQIQDTLMVISDQPKQVSSTDGHQSMDDHPYRQARKIKATENLKNILMSIRNQDFFSFAQIVESEAWDLHALMMSSPKPFCLIESETLFVIKQITKIRLEEKIPFCFTLDAGPNVHVLYPKAFQAEVLDKINLINSQIGFKAKLIHDEVGMGASKIKQGKEYGIAG